MTAQEKFIARLFVCIGFLLGAVGGIHLGLMF